MVINLIMRSARWSCLWPGWSSITSRAGCYFQLMESDPFLGTMVQSCVLVCCCRWASCSFSFVYLSLLYGFIWAMGTLMLLRNGSECSLFALMHLNDPPNMSNNHIFCNWLVSSTAAYRIKQLRATVKYLVRWCVQFRGTQVSLDILHNNVTPNCLVIHPFLGTDTDMKMYNWD